jgi:release factor glutamine methyltransferase
MWNSTASRSDAWTILKLIEWTTSYFTARAIESPRAAAEILLAHALNLQRVDLYLRHDQPLTQPELKRFKGLIQRRASREPVAYILGHREFWSMNLAVTRDVLIPRPETECLVERALAAVAAANTAAPARIIELGTGSGAIILALASRLAGSVCFASDVSEAALRLARENTRHLRLSGRIRFFCGDWTRPLRVDGAAFDLIVSNPPYIPTGQIAALEPEIALYEPHRALDGGNDGLACVRHLVTGAHGLLRPGASLLLEIGHDQQEAVRQIVAATGQYGEPLFSRDYAGHIRVVEIRKE